MRKGKELNIVGVKTNKGYYISEQPNATYGSTSLPNYRINGEDPKKTFHSNWAFVSTEPAKVETLKYQPDINHRYELIDKELESKKFPLVFQREEVSYYDEHDYEWEWKDEYSHLRSLYRLVSDKQDPIYVELEFTYETILEVDELIEPGNFSFTVQRTQWTHEGTREYAEKDVHYQLLDRMMFPDIVLSQRPAKFTSEQMYKIVREYIKQHIDYTYADITSDYNFCFTVVKRIPLKDTIVKQTEITKSNGRPYRKPRYNTRYIKDRTVTVFEMTHAKENYKGYTPIPAMVGENLQDLKEKVDRYCEDLIKIINAPLHDCPHCNGDGVIHRDGVKVQEFFK